MSKVITVDGPSASGKSALSRALARKLSIKWLSTGVFYRGLAYMALSQKLANASPESIAQLISQKNWAVQLTTEQSLFIYEQKNITKQIYTEHVDGLASRLAGMGAIRKVLLPCQRQFLLKNPGGLVAEGRDCGTVVFPTARLKIYLTAKDHIRAHRRAKQRSSLPVKDVEILQKKRDQRDIERALSPLQKAKGALVMDTGQISFNQMVEKAYKAAQTSFL